MFYDAIKKLRERHKTSHLLLFVQKRNGENGNHGCSTEEKSLLLQYCAISLSNMSRCEGVLDFETRGCDLCPLSSQSWFLETMNTILP